MGPLGQCGRLARSLPDYASVAPQFCISNQPGFPDLHGIRFGVIDRGPADGELAVHESGVDSAGGEP